MFFFVHGPRRERDTIAVLFGCFDGSSTHDSAKVWTLCGWLGEREAFESLDEQWARVLGKKDWRRRPTEFHMYDCVHGFGDFFDWSFPERLALFGDLATVVTQSNILAIGSIVIVDDLMRLDTDESALLQSQALGTPLDLSLQYILQRVIKKTHEYSHDEDVRILFDDEPPAVADRYYAFADYYRTKFGRCFKGIGFGNSAKFTCLQAADMLAYCTYRFEMQRRFQAEAERDFPVVPGFKRLIQNVAADGGGYDFEALKKLVVLVKTNKKGTFSL
jgi:hypothetical protein